MVKAIETLFEPVVIYNNQSGNDSKVLKQFGEPSWNYQVVRFLNDTGKDIIPRKDRVWTTQPLANRMIKTLDASNQTIPDYLRALAGQAKPKQ